MWPYDSCGGMFIGSFLGDFFSRGFAFAMGACQSSFVVFGPELVVFAVRGVVDACVGREAVSFFADGDRVSGAVSVCDVDRILVFLATVGVDVYYEVCGGVEVFV